MRIPFDLSNTTTRVLTCAGVVAAGTVGAAILPAGVAVAFGSAAAGIAGNLLATDIDKEVRSRLKASEVLRNPDLERLCGEAIRLVIIKATESSKPLFVKYKSRIKEFAEKVPTEWSKIINAPSWRIELEQADIKAIPSCLLSFDDHESCVSTMTALNPELWQKTLAAIRDEKPPKLPDEVLNMLAESLQREYPVAVRELLKRDELGFRALELMFMKTMLDRMDAFSQEHDGADRKEVMDAISTFANAAESTKVEWARKHKKWLEQLDAAARERHEEVIFRIESGFDSVGDALQLVNSALARIEENIQEIRDFQERSAKAQLSADELTQEKIKDLAIHITDEFAFDRMESAARETFKQAIQEFDRGNYALAAGLFEKTADQASKSKAKDLEVNALLRVILSEINQATLVERSKVFPIARWNSLLELARLHDVRRADRFITEARVAILCGDLDTAFDRVSQARNEREKHNYYIVEIARLSAEILSRKLKLKPQQSVIDSLVNEEKVIRMDLAAMSATSVVLVYSPIIESFVATGLDITESIKVMNSSIAGTDANKSERDSFTEAVALIRIGQAAERLHGSNWGVEVARIAVAYATKFGNAIEQAKIGDLLASVITEGDCTKEDLHELLELRHKWCSGLSEDFTTLADLSDESFNLYLFHRAMAIRDRYRIAVLDIDQVDASEWFALSIEADAVTKLIDQKKDRLTWPASSLAVNLIHIKAECLTHLGEYGKAADSFSTALKRGEEVAIDPETQLLLARESVYFYCSAGNVLRARDSRVAAETICSKMGKVFEHGRGLDALIETTQETRRWLSSGDAETIRRTGRESGIREAMKPTIQHLFELWDDIPSNYNCHAAVYDYWGRGSFLRLCVAIQGKPTDCFTLDASSVDDIRLAAEMLCPMFEVVMVKWKGKLLPAQKGISGGYVRTDMKQDWLYGSGLVHCKDGFVGYTNDLPDDVITFIRQDARKLVESGRLFVVPAQLIGCAQKFVGASDATFALQLLQGSFLGVGEDVDGVSESVERTLVRLHKMKLPYYRDLNLSDLSDILDDVGGQARYFHSRIREMISAGDFEKARYDAMKEDAIARKIDDAIMELREIYQSVDKSVSNKLDTLSIEQMVAPRGPGVSGTNVTHMLSSILPVGSDLKAWVPFSRIAGAGGCFSWGSAPIRNAIPAPVNTIDFSWLAPPTMGAGAVGSWV
jgi:hypothetical protein